MGSFFSSNILAHATLADSAAFLLTAKLATSTLLPTALRDLFRAIYVAEPELIVDMHADLEAVHNRDPACDTYSQALLFFKGFQALQCHRVCHHLWTRGRRSLALALASRISEVRPGEGGGGGRGGAAHNGRSVGGRPSQKGPTLPYGGPGVLTARPQPSPQTVLPEARRRWGRSPARLPWLGRP